MPFDGITAKALAIELNQLLSDARIDKIYQPEKYDLVFFLRQPGKQYKLLISANPASPRIHLTERSKQNPNEPPMFCMLLRKHLLGARLISIETPQYERIFSLRFSVVNELGDTLEKRLYVEIMGRHSNIILVNQDDRIHDSILHVDNDMSRVREIMPARPYQLPPEQNKKTPQQILESIANKQLWLLPQALPQSIDRALLDTCQGFSPRLCQEVVDRAGIDKRTRALQLTEYQLTKLNQTIKLILEQIIAGSFEPSLFFIDPITNVPADFHALPLSGFSKSMKTGSVSEAMDRFYGIRDEQNILHQKRQYLAKVITNQLDHTNKKLQIHLSDQQEGEKQETYRQFGDLILSNINETERALREGQDKVSLLNFYDADMRAVDIQLQVNRTAAWNAQNYFRRYNKAKTKYETGSRLAEQDRQDIIWLESLQKAVDNADSVQDLTAIKQEMNTFGLLSKTHDTASRKSILAEMNNQKRLDTINRLNPGKPGKSQIFGSNSNRNNKKRNNKKSTKTGRQESLPPRRWLSSDKIEILAGRNNIQNDQLTLKTANKNDIWLHVQKMPGTHVIIRTAGNELPDSTLLEAAGIAAWFSKAGKSGAGALKLPVDYCPVSHVRKPNGARPGMVIYDQYNTIIVEPLNPQDLEEFFREI